jgi:hypothetical protein
MRMGLVPTLAICLATAGGCSDRRVPTYPVTGKVVFDDGQPVRTGIVEFESTAHGTTASGKIQDDGTFELGTFESKDGAAVGAHRVIVVQMVINDGVSKHHKNHGRRVDPMFGSYDDSGLSATVEAIGQNVITITLPK